jgi:hypothetical protein
MIAIMIGTTTATELFLDLVSAPGRARI